MTHVLHYGKSSMLSLEIRPEVLVSNAASVTDEIVSDPTAAVMAALQGPAGYPPLVQAVVPGDRVAIPVDLAVPQVSQVVAGVVQTLISGGVVPADIVVLTANGAGTDAGWAQALAGDAAAVAVRAHDPCDKGALCYLAAAKDAAPIYLNRHLCEADVIVPVNLLRPRGALGYAGLHSGLFPLFADESARERFRTPSSTTQAVERRRRHDEADEVAWLLGLQLTIQIVAGPGNSIRHILAGLVSQVATRGAQLAEAAWSRQFRSKASLVVAAIAGENDEQSWENFGRALHGASEVCTDTGTIVLCTGLQRELGPALQRLARSTDEDRLWQRLQHDRSEDALPARLLLEHRHRQHIYLLSDLDGSTVESLGIGCITSRDEIDHLSRQADSCILLADAHRAVPRVAPRPRRPVA